MVLQGDVIMMAIDQKLRLDRLLAAEPLLGGLHHQLKHQPAILIGIFLGPFQIVPVRLKLFCAFGQVRQIRIG